MPYIALQVPQKKSVRILHETETDGARAVDARRHHQEFAVLGQFISLREIPDRTLRLVIASPSENCHSCMLIEKFICPLPHIAHKIHHTKGTGTVRMCVYWIGTAHCAVLTRFSNRGCIPLVAPGIDAAIGALRGVLPLPFVRQALSDPRGVAARVLDGHPGHRPMVPACGEGTVFPIAQTVQVGMGMVAR